MSLSRTSAVCQARALVAWRAREYQPTNPVFESFGKRPGRVSMNAYACLCCILVECKRCNTRIGFLSAVTRVTKTPESHFLLYVLYSYDRDRVTVRCPNSSEQYLTQGHSEGRHRHTAPRAPPQVFLLTNTIGQRNRNTLAINSKRTPSERNNELQESRREQVHWSREESTSCREVELYKTSQTNSAQGC